MIRTQTASALPVSDRIRLVPGLIAPKPAYGRLHVAITWRNLRRLAQLRIALETYLQRPPVFACLATDGSDRSVMTL